MLTNDPIAPPLSDHLTNWFILLHLMLFEPVQEVHMYIQLVYTTISQTGSSCSTSCSLNLYNKYIYTMSVHYHLINRFILLHLHLQYVLTEKTIQEIYTICLTEQTIKKIYTVVNVQTIEEIYIISGKCTDYRGNIYNKW